jgi:predicted transcriptional regulator
VSETTDSTDTSPYATSITARVVYELAHEPALTAQELATRLDEVLGSVNSAITRLYRSGLLVRRQRDTSGRGPPPYEYALAAKPGEEADDD